MRKPIKYFNLNQCPKCYGELRLIEKTTLNCNIGDNGEVIPDADETFMSKLQCKNCGNEYEPQYSGLNNEKVRIKRTLPPVIVRKEYNPFFKG